MVILFLADGFEEIEALATLDILRRCGVEVMTVSISGQEEVEGAHQLRVQADALFEAIDLSKAEALVLPGGTVGAQNLGKHVALRDALIAAMAGEAQVVGAICAAPTVLGQHGLLAGRRAVCYPGLEDQLIGALPPIDPSALVCEDGQLITGRGPGATIEFAFTLAARFAPEATIRQVRQGMLL